MRAVLSALVAVPLVLASCAPGPMTQADGATRSSALRPCFYSDQIRNFREAGPGRVFVRDNRDQVFEIESSGGCFDVGSTNRFAIVTDLPGAVSSRACVDDSVRILVPEGAGVRSDICRARITSALSEAEVAALPDRQRP